jgi:hypothetical protein
VARQGCDALHQGFVAGTQRYVDCAAGARELRIDVHALPDPEREPEASREIVGMVAMVESSWCLAHKLVLEPEEAAVTIAQPGGRTTRTPCLHFLRR